MDVDMGCSIIIDRYMESPASRVVSSFCGLLVYLLLYFLCCLFPVLLLRHFGRYLYWIAHRALLCSIDLLQTILYPLFSICNAYAASSILLVLAVCQS